MEQFDSKVSPKLIEVDWKEKYRALVYDQAVASMESYKHMITLVNRIGELERELKTLKGMIHES